MSKISLNYVKNVRGLPFITVGMRVQSTDSGKFGKITSGNNSGNINVRFDGEKKSKNCHPTWAIKYFDKNNNLIIEFNK